MGNEGVKKRPHQKICIHNYETWSHEPLIYVDPDFLKSFQTDERDVDQLEKFYNLKYCCTVAYNDDVER